MLTLGFADPEARYRRLSSGDVGRIAEVGDAVTDAMESLDDVASTVDSGMSTASAGWQGEAAESYLDRIRHTGATITGALGLLGRLGTTVRAAAAAYTALLDQAGHIIQVWRDRPPNEDEVALARLASQVNLALHLAGERYEQALGAALGVLTGTERDPRLSGPLVALKELLFDDADGPTIPNTLASGDDAGWIPQGLAYSPGTDQLLVSYYGEDSDTDSLLSVIDENSGAEVTNARLGGVDLPGPFPAWGAPPNHSGGVAVDGDNVWVTSSEDDRSYVYRYSLADIQAADKGETVDATDRFPVGASSYATFAEGRLWVGSFHEDRPGVLFSYDVEPDGTVADAPTSAQQTPEKIQGVVVRDDEFILSQSYGRDNLSSLLTQQRNNPLGHLYTQDHTVPNLSEGITEVDGDILTLYESGAGKYADGSWPRDRTTRTPVEDLAGDGFHVEPAALRDAAGELDTATDAISAAASLTSRTQLVPAALGEVAAAAPFAAAVTRCLAALGHHLTDGTRSVRDAADALVDNANTYHRLEEAALNTFNPFR